MEDTGAKGELRMLAGLAQPQVEAWFLAGTVGAIAELERYWAAGRGFVLHNGLEGLLAPGTILRIDYFLIALQICMELLDAVANFLAVPRVGL